MLRFGDQPFEEVILEEAGLRDPPFGVLENQQRALGFQSDGKGGHGFLLAESDDTRVPPVSASR
jgi:hypothetical protein